jgi:hypothetical protein
MPSTHQPPHRSRRLIPAAITALAVGATTLAFNTGSASAASLPQKCSGAAAANVCLNGYTDTFHHTVHVNVGVDVHMSRQEAQQLVNDGWTLSARVWGYDGPNVIQFIPISDLTKVTSDIVWDGGLSAEFDMDVAASALDEDHLSATCFWRTCDRDEIFARVSLYNPIHGGYQAFDSGYWEFYADAV